MPVPVHRLARTEDFLEVLDGRPTKFSAGDSFSCCNAGYVVLALLAERASQVPFHDLVHHSAGASFFSVHPPERQVTWTVIANTVEGAAPVQRAIRERLVDPRDERR